MVSPWTSPLAQLAPTCCQWATVQVRYSAKLQAVLAQLELSLLLSTGQAGQLISIGSHQVGLCAGCRALPGGWIAIGAMPQWASVASAAPASPRPNRRQLQHLPQAVALICESLIPDPASPQHPA